MGATRGRMASRDRCLFAVLYFCGLRVSEALALRRKDVIDEGQIVPELQVMTAKSHGRKKRHIVYLHAELVSALMAWLRDMEALGWQTGNCYLFHRLGHVNAPISRTHAWRIVQQAAKGDRSAHLAGCIGTHSFRKGFGEDIYEDSGRNIRSAQEALRHQSPEATQYYLRIGSQVVKDLVLQRFRKGG